MKGKEVNIVIPILTTIPTFPTIPVCYDMTPK